MRPKKPRPKKGPPAEFTRWLEKHVRSGGVGRAPTPEHELGIWSTTFIPERYIAASADSIKEAEDRLGVEFPESLKKQLCVQNGGWLDKCKSTLFGDETNHWTNATVDGIEQLKDWSRADKNAWFDNVDWISGRGKLIVIAGHSESRLCLDYRKSRHGKSPAVVYVDTSMRSVKPILLCKTVDEWIGAIVAARTTMK